MAAARVSRSGGVHALGPVAPLVEACSGGVQHQDGRVLHNGKLDLIKRPGLRQGIQAIPSSQAGGGRLLDNGLTGGDRVEGGIQAVPLPGTGPPGG